MPDDVVINIRARGGSASRKEFESTAGGVRLLQRAVDTASVGLRNFRTNTNLSTNSAYLLRHALYAGLSYAFYRVGEGAVQSGIQFNATMESNQVAFTQLLGSAQSARKELTYLYKTAASTPFETTNITTAERQLLAFGFTAKTSNAWLATIGDTIAGMGGGTDQINQLVLALGQIQSKGRLQGQELLQLQQLGVLNTQRLAKDLGMSVAELTSGQANVSSTKALRAIKKQFDSTFGGQAAKQAKTFNGQLSTLHDNLSMTLGAVTYPGFVYLRDKVFPTLNDAAGDIQKIFDRKDIDVAEKLTLSRQALKTKLGPMVREIDDELGDLNLPHQLTVAFDAAAPVVLREGVSLGGKVAAAFGNAWLHAGAWTKFASGAWLAHKLGLDKAAAKGLLRLVTGGGVAGGIAGDVLGGRGSITNPLYVVQISGKTPPVPDNSKSKTPWWTALLKPKVAGPIAFLTAYFGNVDSAGLSPDQENANLRKAKLSEQLYRAGVKSPTLRKQIIESHINLNVDGKTLAKIVNQVNADDKARGKQRARGG
jgi:tape measure domain-containing protein